MTTEFQLVQKRSITTELKSPFVVCVVFRDMRRKSRSKRFACGYRALQYLKDLRLTHADHYGADCADDNGTMIAEREALDNRV